jgi:hypothetical protein
VWTPPRLKYSPCNTLHAATSLLVCCYRASVHRGLQATPGSLAFARDMILDNPVVADWTLIRDRRQQLIDQRLVTANRDRFSHDYGRGLNLKL